LLLVLLLLAGGRLAFRFQTTAAPIQRNLPQTVALFYLYLSQLLP
jgi:hypothetical protein